MPARYPEIAIYASAILVGPSARCRSAGPMLVDEFSATSFAAALENTSAEDIDSGVFVHYSFSYEKHRSPHHTNTLKFTAPGADTFNVSLL